MPSITPQLRLAAGLPFALVYGLLALPVWGQDPPASNSRVGVCPLPQLGPLPKGPEDKLELAADTLDFTAGGLSSLAGAVRLAMGDRELLAPELEFDDDKRIATVKTPSRFRNADFTLNSEQASYDFNADTGIFTDTHFNLNSIGGRGSAQRFMVAKSGMAQLEGVRFTTCGEDSNAWELRAKSIHLDRESGLGQARSASLRLAGVPVIYLPYLQYPIDGERHTGLLFPSIGSDSRVGLDFRMPFYLNLAPNYDAIITPRLMSDRGVQLGMAGRYLLPRSQGRINVELMPHDQQTSTSRNLAEFHHEGRLNNRVSTEINFAEVSDRSYFEDLSSRSAFSTLTHLERSARLTYHAPSSYTLTALVQDYQPLSGNLAGVDDPYRRLPELRFDALSRNEYLHTRLGGTAAITNFARNNSVQGLRETLHPFLQTDRDFGPLSSSGRLGLLYTGYQLENTAPGQSSSAQRVTPIFSIDARLPFEKFSTDSLQTLTPRLFYLYVPYRNQDQLPLFDTGEPDYDFPQLFSRNRFNGGDRIADANQLTTALTWRVLDALSGEALISASLGQTYRFSSTRVTLPGEVALDAGSSDYLADASIRLNSRLNLVTSVNFSADEGRFNRNAVALRYRYGEQKADIAYRFRSQQLEQADLSFSTPIAKQWRLAGRVRNSLRDDRLLDSLLGVEYETCCWALRSSYRRTLVNSRGEFSSGVYFQLELKGLTRFGTGFDEVLPGGSRSLAEP